MLASGAVVTKGNVREIGRREWRNRDSGDGSFRKVERLLVVEGYDSDGIMM